MGRWSALRALRPALASFSALWAGSIEPFGVSPSEIRAEWTVTEGNPAHGCKSSAFAGMWTNHSIPETPSLSVTTSQPLTDNGFG